jgi:hypothetical protein
MAKTMSAQEIYAALEREFRPWECTEVFSTMGLQYDHTDTVRKVYTATFVSDEAVDVIVGRGETDVLLFTHHPVSQKKDLTKVIAAHNVPYVAQSTFIGNMKDLAEKSRKAIYTPGAAFLNVMAPCPRGWRYPSEDIMAITKAAVETCVWPLFEVVEGKWILNYEPKNKLPVEAYLKPQGRFAHMFKPGNEWMVEEYQKEVDRKWEELLSLCGK